MEKEFAEHLYEKLLSMISDYMEDKDENKLDNILLYSNIYRNLLDINQINATVSLSNTLRDMASKVDTSKFDMSKFLNFNSGRG